jgi:hypothetical protein
MHEPSVWKPNKLVLKIRDNTHATDFAGVCFVPEWPECECIAEAVHGDGHRVVVMWTACQPVIICVDLAAWALAPAREAALMLPGSGGLHTHNQTQQDLHGGRCPASAVFTRTEQTNHERRTMWNVYRASPPPWSMVHQVRVQGGAQFSRWHLRPPPNPQRTTTNDTTTAKHQHSSKSGSGAATQGAAGKKRQQAAAKQRQRTSDEGGRRQESVTTTNSATLAAADGRRASSASHACPPVRTDIVFSCQSVRARFNLSTA